MANATWRLIRSGPRPGSWNMALDDALLQAVADGVSAPVLRLYRWQPATLTLGYAQSATTGIDLEACQAAGIAVVRRPTGGRAVLHDREVTYAVIAPAAPPFGTAIAESYRTIAGVLRESLRQFGLSAELVPGRPGSEHGRTICFTAPTQHELLIDGCKVAGCAQKRRGPAFLQHGSIPLDLDLALLKRLMPGESDSRRPDRLHAVGWLNRFASRPLAIGEVEDALVAAFTSVLGIRFEESAPTDVEEQLAERLRARFYDDPAWTVQGPGPLSPARADGD